MVAALGYGCSAAGSMLMCEAKDYLIVSAIRGAGTRCGRRQRVAAGRHHADLPDGTAE
jgi:hypothetical protein